MPKRVYIAYTGGTIGMNRTRGGYCPEPGYLQRQMATMPELGHPSMPSYTIHEYAPLLDSSNMTPAEWVKIAHDIDANYARYDVATLVEKYRRSGGGAPISTQIRTLER